MNTNVNTPYNRRVSVGKGCIAATGERVMARVVEGRGLVSCNSEKKIYVLSHADPFPPRAGFFRWGNINRVKIPLIGYQIKCFWRS
jgi:hypothetical protein